MQHFEALSFISWIKKTNCNNFLLYKTNFIVWKPHIPYYINLLRHDLGLRPLKIISLISNKAKRLGGVNTGYSKNVLSQHLTRPEPEPTVVRWLCDSETVLLTCCLQGRQNCKYTWRVTDLYWKLSELHTTCFTVWTEELYISKNVVCNKFLPLKRLCERTIKSNNLEPERHVLTSHF